MASVDKPLATVVVTVVPGLTYLFDSKVVPLETFTPVPLEAYTKTLLLAYLPRPKFNSETFKSALLSFGV